MRPTLDRREAERLVNTYADSILRLSYACLDDTQGAQALCQTILRQRLEQGACLDDPAKERLWFLRATFRACQKHTTLDPAAKRRVAWFLCEGEGLSHREAARVMGGFPGNVAALLQETDGEEGAR